MTIDSIDGLHLRQAVIAGARRVILMQDNLNKINDRKVKLIMDYAKNYGNISDTMAKDMLKEFFDIQNATLKLKKKYVKKFENVLPPKKVFRYFQTENKLDALINIQLASEIPLMR